MRSALYSFIPTSIIYRLYSQGKHTLNLCIIERMAMHGEIDTNPGHQFIGERLGCSVTVRFRFLLPCSTFTDATLAEIGDLNLLYHFADFKKIPTVKQ